MTREQAEQIARKHFAGADCTRELQRAVNAIMEAAAIERADEREACAETCLERHANGRFKHDTRDECADAIRASGA